MSDISKQFEAWVTSLRQSEFERAAFRLTAYYIAGIFLILAVSSITIFSLSTLETETRFQNSGDGVVEEISETTVLGLPEFKEHLKDTIIIVDIAVLVFASIASYFFARQTLKPIEVVYRKQEEFMGNVAHELRTPLSVMKSGAEATLRKERPVTEYTHFIRESLEEVNRMSLLTDNLLFLLKHKSVQRQKYEAVNVTELAEIQVEWFAAYAHEKHVTVTLEANTPATLSGVPEMLTRLFQNLIKNAIDYNVEGGKVVVRVQPGVEEVLVSVSDTGIGMSDADRARVFERFYKADTARTHTHDSGTGLGLSIVNEIVSAHHGTITVESTLGVGTTCTIRFPKNVPA